MIAPGNYPWLERSPDVLDKRRKALEIGPLHGLQAGVDGQSFRDAHDISLRMTEANGAL